VQFNNRVNSPSSRSQHQSDDFFAPRRQLQADGFGEVVPDAMSTALRGHGSCLTVVLMASGVTLTDAQAISPGPNTRDDFADKFNCLVGLARQHFAPRIIQLALPTSSFLICARSDAFKFPRQTSDAPAEIECFDLLCIPLIADTTDHLDDHRRFNFLHEGFWHDAGQHLAQGQDGWAQHFVRFQHQQPEASDLSDHCRLTFVRPQVLDTLDQNSMNEAVSSGQCVRENSLGTIIQLDVSFQHADELASRLLVVAIQYQRNFLGVYPLYTSRRQMVQKNTNSILEILAVQ
jgi:hypothetical protein